MIQLLETHLTVSVLYLIILCYINQQIYMKIKCQVYKCLENKCINYKNKNMPMIM